MNRYVKLILVLWVALPALIICSRQVDEPSNSIDGEEVTWELRNYDGSTLVGSGDPPKLWVRTFPQVKQKKVSERSKEKSTAGLWPSSACPAFEVYLSTKAQSFSIPKVKSKSSIMG